MKLLTKIAVVVGASLMALPAFAENEFIAGIPRNQTLILQGPGAQNANWFNLWAPGGGASPNGLQQLTGDTLWFINPEGGKDAWQNALAADKPVYNDDFTQMTVKLKEGIYWSDGVEFTADDVAYTVADPDRPSGHGMERSLHGQRRKRRDARPRHRDLSTEVAELALPYALHRALERGVDHAEACLRESRGPAEVRQQSPGLAERLYAQQLRSRPVSGRCGSCATTGSGPASA